MLRNAEAKDLFPIMGLIILGSAEGQVLPRTLKEVEEVLPSFFVWEEHDLIVGCCQLDIYSKKLAEIRSLVVSPDYRGRGVATNLINACLEKSREEGIYEVLAVTDKDKLFEKVGFRKCLDGQWPMFIKPGK